MSKARDFMAPAPSIITRAELDQRRAARSRPVLENHLTTDGWQSREVRCRVDAMAEDRITYLENRLSRAREDLLAGHRLANIRGHPKRVFGHSR